MTEVVITNFAPCFLIITKFFSGNRIIALFSDSFSNLFHLLKGLLFTEKTVQTPSKSAYKRRRSLVEITQLPVRTEEVDRRRHRNKQKSEKHRTLSSHTDTKLCMMIEVHAIFLPTYFLDPISSLAARGR